MVQSSFQITVAFRRCRAGDLPALEWMGLHSADRAIMEASFAAQERGEALMLVAESAGFPVAQAWLDFAERGTPERPHLWAVRVFPPLQGAGLGSALMETAERHAAEKGARALELGVEPHNHRARRFYERLGYEQIEFRPKTVHHGPDGQVLRTDPDQAILRKELGSAPARSAKGRAG